MSVYKSARSPYWQYDFQFRGQRFHGSTGCTSRRAAEAFEARERHKAALPSLARPPITLDEAAGLYTEHAERLPSWKTIEYMLDALIAGLGENVRLADITQRDLQVYFAKRRNGRSNASVNREIENARALWRRADRTRFDVGEMPDWAALRLKVAEHPPRELDAGNEEPALLAALDADTRALVTFLVDSGWRRGEALGLRWSDLDLPNREAVTKIKGGDVVRRPLTMHLIALIANQPKVGPFVFTYVCRKSRAKRRQSQRYPFTASVLRDRWAEALGKAKLPPIRIHDLRHTLGTRIVRATGNLAAAKEALKHRHIKTTLRYAHVLADDVRTALDAAKSRNSPELPSRKNRKA